MLSTGYAEEEAHTCVWVRTSGHKAGKDESKGAAQSVAGEEGKAGAVRKHSLFPTQMLL